MKTFELYISVEIKILINSDTKGPNAVDELYFLVVQKHMKFLRILSWLKPYNKKFRSVWFHEIFIKPQNHDLIKVPHYLSFMQGINSWWVAT